MRRGAPAALTLVAVLSALSGLSACAGGEPDPAPEAPAEATAATAPDPAAASSEIAALFTRLSPESASAADCFGEALTRDRTPAELQAAGLLTETGTATDQLPALDRETARTWVDAWFGCVDYIAVAARAQAKATRGGLDAAGYRECLREAMTDAELRAAATDGLAGDAGSAAVRRLGEAQAACAEQNADPS